MIVMSKKLTLPILVGISLTGVCAGLLYFFYKKNDDDKVFNVKDVKKNMKIAMKVPRELVPMIIGRGGESIKDIQDRSSTRIRFANDDITMPERICYIEGTYECINLAQVMIKNIIESQPLIETYDILVSQRIRSLLLANKAEHLHDIQASSKAKIIIERGFISDPNAKRSLTIKGSAEQIATALSYIEEMMQNEKMIQKKLEINETVRSPRGKTSPRNSSTPQPTETSPSVEEPLMRLESIMEVYVSAAETPSQFWVQLVGPKVLALDDLIDKMTEYYKNPENQQLHLLKNITTGQMVAAKFSIDMRWYRAEVRAVSTDDDGNKEYGVFFVDYGDYEVVSEGNIFELRTDFLSLRFQAIECSLARVKPKNEEWSEEACDRFNELCRLAEWKVITAKVRGFKERITYQGTSRREGSPIPYVDLFNKHENQEINIGKQLISENFAVSETGDWSAASSTLSLSQPSQNVFSNSNSNSNSKSISSLQSAETCNEFIPPVEPNIDVIDLVTPRKSSSSAHFIEEINLVTPDHSKKETSTFIKSEKKSNSSKNLIKIKPVPDSSSEYDSDELEMF